MSNSMSQDNKNMLVLISTVEMALHRKRLSLDLQKDFLLESEKQFMQAQEDYNNKKLEIEQLEKSLNEIKSQFPNE